MAETATSRDPQEQARRQATYLSGLVWHVGTFLIINALLWVIDLVAGTPQVDWAYWVTLFWGLALAFHALAYLVDGRQLEERTYRRVLARRERERSPAGESDAS